MIYVIFAGCCDMIITNFTTFHSESRSIFTSYQFKINEYLLTWAMVDKYTFSRLC
jgi:hypothetical protein